MRRSLRAIGGIAALASCGGCIVSRSEQGVCFRPMFKMVYNGANAGTHADAGGYVVGETIEVAKPTVVGEGVLVGGTLVGPVGAPLDAGTVPFLPGPGLTLPTEGQIAAAPPTAPTPARVPAQFKGIALVNTPSGTQQANVGDTIKVSVFPLNNGGESIDWVEVDATASDNLRIVAADPATQATIQGGTVKFARLANIRSVSDMRELSIRLTALKSGSAQMRVTFRSSALSTGQPYVQDISLLILDK